MTPPLSRQLEGSAECSSRGGRCEIARLHRNLKWGVVGLVLAWMVVLGVSNLVWSKTLVEQEFNHHMTDQARALASLVSSHLGRGESLPDILAAVTDWPGRLHELDLLSPGDRVAISSSPLPQESATSERGYGVVVPVEAGGTVRALRLWMPTERLTQQYHHVAMVNLVAIAAAGLILAALMGMATARASRRYEALFEQVEQLEARQARAERLEAMGRMAAGVAHEIRNPLNAIGLGIQRIQRELLPCLGHPANGWNETVARLYTEVRRLDGVVESFLSLSRPLELSAGRFDATDVVRHVDAFYGPEAAQSRVTFEVAVPGEPLEVTGDKDSVTQLLANLVRNGLEAVKASGRPGTVRLELAVEPGRYRLAVSDNAGSLAEKDLERIFEMFYTTKPRGTGLGLSCARRIAEAHGGRLQAASSDGWTVFTATMPLDMA